MKTASFDIEQRVTIKASKGRIVIEPADKFDFRLEDLVAGITRENVHDEVDFGRTVGKEAL
jgi:antitoxin MazE